MKNKHLAHKFVIIFILVILIPVILVASGFFTIKSVLLIAVTAFIFVYLINMYRTLIIPGQWFFKKRFMMEGVLLCIFCPFILMINQDIPVTLTNIIITLSIGLFFGLTLGWYLFQTNYNKKIRRITFDNSIPKDERLTDLATFVAPEGDIEGIMTLTKNKLYFASKFLATHIREYTLDDSAKVVLLHKYGLPIGFSINNDSYKINYTRLWIKEISKITHKNFL